MEQSGGKVKVLRQVKARGKLLNLTATEARNLGISSATVESMEKAYAVLGANPGTVVRISRSWSETFVGPALLAAGCFGLVFFGHYLVGLADSTEIIMFLLGATLLVVECMTPGFGIVGASGILLIIASLVLSLQNFIIPSNPYQWNSLTGNFLTLTASTGAAVLVFASVLRFLPNTPLFGKLVLKAELAPAEAHAATVLIGRPGVALTPLRPSGKVEVDGMTVDVVAEEGFIEAGRKVTIVKADGPSVVVRLI
ncbi:MAG: hypothetical protein K8T20_07875 [Planctomycetes bacterium]|nr:hypothetical protein [Planctomycetota bacterium]